MQSIMQIVQEDELHHKYPSNKGFSRIHLGPELSKTLYSGTTKNSKI